MHFYCTAGRGTEAFLGKELRDLFKEKLLELTVTDGKVFFELADVLEEVHKVLQLKIAERAFAQVALVKTSELDQRNLLNSIKTSLNNKEAWDDSLVVTGMLQFPDEVDSWDMNQTDMLECKSMSDSADEPVPKKARHVGETTVETWTTFRVNFKCPACFRKRLDIKSVPRQIGMHIKHVTGWKVDLRHPITEICVQLNNEFLTVGVPLTREPLSKRSFIKLIGLRSTVAHIMTDLLKIQPGDTVLDPMCGKATILLEAAHCFKNARYIGIDKSEPQLKSARENVEISQSDDIQLINGDATGLPFSNGSIDKIVTDAPFGNTHTTDIPLKDFYCKILKEFSRVLSPSGKLVILTSSLMKDFITQELESSSLHSLVHDINSKRTSDHVNGNSFTTEKNNESNLIHERPETHISDADTGFGEEVGKTTANSEVNVKSAAVNVPRDVACRKPSDEGFLLAASHGTEDEQSKDFKIKEDTKSTNQEKCTNVDNYKGKSDPVISLVTGVPNDAKESVIDKNLADSINTSSTSNSISDLNNLRQDIVTNVYSQNKGKKDRTGDMTGTNDAINMMDDSDVRKDPETNNSDWNMPTGHAVIVEGYNETGIESEIQQTETAANETYIGDCKECVNFCNTRPGDKSISVEPRDTEKLSKLNKMVLTESHYVKLGETHAYICVLVKSEIK